MKPEILSGYEYLPQLSLRVRGEERNDLLFMGDNLLVLKDLLSDYREKVRCVYIDPPYNTKNTFQYYRDSKKRHIWREFMRERLTLLKEFLSEEGSIWISIDDNEHGTLRVLCDEIFGSRNFVANIPVITNPRGRQLGRFFATCHEYVLVYAKNKQVCAIKAGTTESVKTHEYKYSDANGNYKRLPLKYTNVRFTAESRPSQAYPIYYNPVDNLLSLEPKNGYEEIIPYFANGVRSAWPWSKEFFLARQGELEVIRVNSKLEKYAIFIKRYLTPQTTKKLFSVWDYTEIGTTSDATRDLKKIDHRAIHCQPKPVKLIERIIKGATNEGDLVLDAFMGSGTTAAVCRELGRHWIGIEQAKDNLELTFKRLKFALPKLRRSGVSTYKRIEEND